MYELRAVFGNSAYAPEVTLTRRGFPFGIWVEIMVWYGYRVWGAELGL